MNTLEIGQRLVSLCREGKGMQCFGELFSEDAQSIEATGSPEMPAEMTGLDALRKKSERWYANHEIHGGEVKGPFPNGDRFAVIFSYEVTPKVGPMEGKRMALEEVGLYTVEGGKIVREEFFYAE